VRSRTGRRSGKTGWKNFEKHNETAVTTHLKEADNNISLVICDFSTKLNADLIVIGRHGDKGMFEHMMLGSTAERVVRHAPCSVLVVMPHGILGDAPTR